MAIVSEQYQYFLSVLRLFSKIFLKINFFYKITIRQPFRILSQNSIIRIIIIGTSLTACSEISQILNFDKNNNALVHNALLISQQPLKEGIQITKIEGIDSPMSRLIPKAIATELQEHYLPAHFGQLNVSSKNYYQPRYQLSGKAKVQDKATSASNVGSYDMLINWRLTEYGKNNLLNFTQKLRVPDWKWDNGSPSVISAISSEAVKKVIMVVAEKSKINSASITFSKSPAKIWVVPVTSSIKNGGNILRRAIIAALSMNGSVISENEEDAQYVLSGNFEVLPPVKGNHQVKMIWKVNEKTGKNLGRITQKNNVIAGSFDGNWGTSAAIIAEAAVGGIQELLNKVGDSENNFQMPTRYLKTPPDGVLVAPQINNKT